MLIISKLLYSNRNLIINRKILKMNQEAANISTTSVLNSKKKNRENENYLSFSPRAHNSLQPQIYDYILVLDFEATCDNRKELIPQVSFIFH
jgi:hypothetical protein